ncbi:hypothetical protein [Yoonia sp. R2-816]|uniref:hypothetical protein n=1 Tax=Yoonia sp. R2-816 TaxID=3342638 RepID=UPI00372A81FE
MTGALPFEDIDLLSWINEIVAAIVDFLQIDLTTNDDALNATHLGLTALKELFSMEGLRVAQADRLFERAFEKDPKAIYSAWRAQLRGIQWVERHDTDASVLKEQGLELAQKALAQEPGNSSVLATVSNARQILDGDVFACETLSSLAVKSNPANPLAWWSRALSHSYCGRSKEALVASDRGHKLASGSPYLFWWDMQVAVSACAARQMGRAIIASERAAVFAPTFRPPMRVLTGLHAAHGSQDRAVHWGKKLATLESDFSPDRLIGDPDYPSSLLDRYSLVDQSALRPVTERVFSDKTKTNET